MARHPKSHLQLCFLCFNIRLIAWFSYNSQVMLTLRWGFLFMLTSSFVYDLPKLLCLAVIEQLQNLQ